MIKFFLHLNVSPVKGIFFERKLAFMSTASLILSIIVVIAAVFLICVVLLQSSKNSGVAASLSGGADTFLAKNKNNTWDARLANITKWVAFAFMFVVLLLNLI
jgi:preprotein translocase subunit SecG